MKNNNNINIINWKKEEKIKSHVITIWIYNIYFITNTRIIISIDNWILCQYNKYKYILFFIITILIIIKKIIYWFK